MGARRVSSPGAHSDSRTHTASYLVGTRIKWPGREASDEVKSECSCTPSTITVRTAAHNKQNCNTIKTDLTHKLDGANKCRSVTRDSLICTLVPIPSVAPWLLRLLLLLHARMRNCMCWRCACAYVRASLRAVKGRQQRLITCVNIRTICAISYGCEQSDSRQQLAQRVLHV